MNKVFEKIIEKQKELFQDLNVIEVLSHVNFDSTIQNSLENFLKAITNEAIEIVKQEAEKYNNGWIPCSSGRLPEENADVEVTIEEIANDVGGKRYYNVRSWLQDGQWVIKKNPYNPTVIAWKYPTDPYQPKGE